MGISRDTQKSEDMEVIKMFNDQIKLTNKRYQVPWPWKTSKYELPSNLKLAEGRLKSLVTKLRKSNMLKKYDDIIQQQLNDGIIEIACSSEEYLSRDTVVTHYLPHHLVVTDNGSILKPRVVYEGCAKTHPSKKSLNDCLYRGPNMVANLCGTWLRFRMNRIAMIADIEKGYLQINVEKTSQFSALLMI